MHSVNREPGVSSVKLFPRLAMTNRVTAKPLNRSERRHQPKGPTRGDRREARRDQVRARLLRMILDNEEVRRNDRRPNAS